MKQKPANDISWEIRREFPPDFGDPEYEIADIFRTYGATYIANHNLSPIHLSVMQAIMDCRTNALGGHVDQCDKCGNIEISYNSCRNRNCPKCQGSKRIKWVNARELELLPIQYFHNVFTLPQQLQPLLRYNEKLFYDLLMQTAAETLQTFAQKKWDGKLGITMALHTWGQTLNQHPHVHCIVTGGALKNDGSEFVLAPKNFLFPVKALSRVFREKYLAKLKNAWKSNKLNPFGPQIKTEADWKVQIAPLYKHHWVVYAKKTCDKPEHLIRYIGRYINRVAISNHRIKSIENGRISFEYHDNHNDTDRVMILSADEFIRRYLTHILPKGFRSIRYYGFMVNSQRKNKLTQCRQLFRLDSPEEPYVADMDHYLTVLAYNANLCCRCGEGTMQTIEDIAPNHDPPQQYLEAA